MTHAESLADDVVAGRYKLGQLEKCDSSLPADRNSHVIRFKQFVLFSNPHPPRYGGPEYAIVQPHLLFRDHPPSAAEMEGVVKPLASELLDAVPGAALVDPVTGSIEKIRAEIRDLRFSREENENPEREELRSRSVARDVSPRRVADHDDLPDPDLPDEELRKSYADWLATRTTSALLERVGELYSVALTNPSSMSLALSMNLEDMSTAYIAAFYPAPFQQFETPFAHLALCATYEQIWEPAGYTRGELINSLSLAPGEQVTLELHAWDKTTIKSEEEIAEESELRSAEKMTQRDSLTIAQEFSKNRTSNVTANTTIPIPKISIGLSGNVTNQMQESAQRSQERVSEGTREASQTIRVNRKLRMEVSRDVGRESKQTRVVQNTNRCHSLNCHYSEIMANYLVRTQLASLTPCVLLERERPDITLDWVLCHAYVLTQVLLDKSFLGGFAAAERLRMAEILKQKGAEEAVKDLPANGRSSDLYAVHVKAISDASYELQAASDKSTEAMYLCAKIQTGGGFVGTPRYQTCTITRCGEPAVRRSMYRDLLPQRAHDALARLRDDWVNSVPEQEIVTTFFATADVRAFEPPRDPGLIRSIVDARKNKLYWAHSIYTSSRMLDVGPEDAGMFAAVQAAFSALERQARSAVAPATASPVEPEAIPDKEIAEAEVAWSRLLCHLKEHWLHYAQGVWQKEDPGARFLRLQELGLLATLIGDQVLGFQGHKEAHEITDVAAVKALGQFLTTSSREDRWVDFESQVRDTLAYINQQAPPQFLATVPTLGVVLEAMVSECDACEDYIRQSRILDLRLQEARAKQEEAEVARRRASLKAGDLSASPEPGRLALDVRVIEQGGDE